MADFSTIYISGISIRDGMKIINQSQSYVFLIVGHPIVFLCHTYFIKIYSTSVYASINIIICIKKINNNKKIN